MQYNVKGLFEPYIRRDISNANIWYIVITPGYLFGSVSAFKTREAAEASLAEMYESGEVDRYIHWE